MKRSIQPPPSITHHLIFQTLALLSFFLVSTLSLAAQYDADEYEHLFSDANSKGFMRVWITLDDTVTL